MDRGHEARDLLDGAAYQHRPVVVPVAQAHADARTHGDDVLEDGGILGAVDVIAEGGLQERPAERFAHEGRLGRVLAGDGEVAQALERHFLGMARPADDAQVRLRHAPLVQQMVAHDLVRLRHDALDGTETGLAVQCVRRQLVQGGLQEGAGHGDHQHIGGGHHRTQVRGHGQAPGIQRGAGGVVRVMAVLLHMVDRLLPPDPPAHALLRAGKELHQGRAPGAGADNGHAGRAHLKCTSAFTGLPSRSTVTWVESPFLNMPKAFM